jgi:hypothetical protein
MPLTVAAGHATKLAMKATHDIDRAGRIQPAWFRPAGEPPRPGWAGPDGGRRRSVAIAATPADTDGRPERIELAGRPVSVWKAAP